MSRKLFLDIVKNIESHIADPLPKHFKFYTHRPDATRRMSMSVIMKCTSVIRQLAYGNTPDAFDEYLQMGEHTAPRDTDEVIRLEKESRSKLSDLIRPFVYDKLNNLYDLFVPQREKSSEQRYFSERSRLSHTNVNNGKSKVSFHKHTTLLEKRMDESIQLDKQYQSSLEIFKVKSYVNTIITGVELCKQKIANRTYIGYIDPFIQSTIESNFSPTLRSQLETQKTQFLNEIDRLSREYYYADHMNAILGVYTELDEVTNLQCDYLELLEKCEGLETELSKRNDDLKAQLQDKGIVI
nr:putative nuclease HARBI1 [Tanacetum cinerariifolium]